MAKHKGISLNLEAFNAIRQIKDDTGQTYSEIVLAALSNAPREAQNDPPDPLLAKLVALIDEDVTDPRDLIDRLGVPQKDYIALWHRSLKEGLIVPDPDRGPLVTPEGVSYAGLPP